MASVVRFWSVSVLAAAALAGCGPSIRMVHQSNAYFERCHAADYDPEVTVDLRRRCWAAWLQHYRVGQSSDRVLYARHRLVELELGTGAEPLPGVTASTVSYTASYLTTEDAEEEGEEPTAETGDPPDPDAALGDTRPDVVEDPAGPPHDDEHGIRTDRRDRRPELMRGACAQVCAPRWNTCMERCEGRAHSCERACEAEQRTCMRGCY